jgi:methionyl-tRNA synthetase
MATFEEWKKLDLRTARVIEARLHPNADRLLVIDVDLGPLGPRQIVAGIRAGYAPEALTGKTVVVVANLDPAAIRGVTSHGMLLAVKDGESLAILGPDREVPPGLPVS